MSQYSRNSSEDENLLESQERHVTRLTMSKMSVMKRIFYSYILKQRSLSGEREIFTKRKIVSKKKKKKGSFPQKRKQQSPFNFRGEEKSEQVSRFVLWGCANVSYSMESGGRILSSLPQAVNFCLRTGVEVKCFPLLKAVIKKMWLLWSSLELKPGNQSLLIYLPILGMDSLPTIHWQWELCPRPRLEIISSVA